MMLAGVKADSAHENAKSVSRFSPVRRVYLPAGLGWKWHVFPQRQKAAFIPTVCFQFHKYFHLISFCSVGSLSPGYFLPVTKMLLENSELTLPIRGMQIRAITVCPFTLCRLNMETGHR